MMGQVAIRMPSPSARLTLPETIFLETRPEAWGCEASCDDGGVGIDLNGPRIVWSAAQASSYNSPPIGECLDGFIRLANAPTEKVLQYARRWGVLALCDEHGMPVTHGCGNHPLGEFCHLQVREWEGERPSLRCDRETWRKWTSLEPLDADWYWEPINGWQAYSRLFKAILRVASRVSVGLLADVDDVQLLATYAATVLDWDDTRLDPEQLDQQAGVTFALTPGNLRGIFADAEFQRDLVVAVTDALLGMADFIPRMEWIPGSESPAVVIGEQADDRQGLGASARLFPSLVMRLCAVLQSPYGIYLCDDCGEPFTPEKRRPRGDRRQFCQLCSQGAGLAAKRMWWRTHRSPGRSTLQN